MKLSFTIKKLVLWVVLAGFLSVLAASGWLFLAASNLPQVDFLSDPQVSFKVNFLDWQKRYIPFTVGPQNPNWVSLEKIPRNLQNAVMAGEDFSFYSHKGIDWFELRESLLKDFREGRFVRGASTISQQLAKNLFLSRDKTVKRKVRELVLALRMEKTLTKDRILELYLNVVELGDMVYGVGAGALHHFGKQPLELSLRESAFLAAMLPGPKVYDPDRHMDRVMNRSDHLLGVMLKGRMITEDQYLSALAEIPFSGELSDNVNTKPDSEDVNDIPLEDAEKSISDEEQFSTEEQLDDLPVDSAPDKELFAPHEGIVEIPIGKSKVNSE